MISVQVASMLITSGVVGGTLGAMLVGFPLLRKKGVNVGTALDKAESVVDTSGKILDVAKEVLPTNPALVTLEVIEKWAKIAVGQAQQLYHAGDISKEGRKAIAETSVYSVLKELNIDVTDSKKILINASIENAVNDLGHDSNEVKTTEQKAGTTQQTVEKYPPENSQDQQQVQSQDITQSNCQGLEQNQTTQADAQSSAQTNTQPSVSPAEALQQIQNIVQNIQQV